MLSLRTKLIIWYLALISLALITFSAAIYFSLSHSLLNIIDASLLDQAEVLARNYQASQQPTSVEAETAHPGHGSNARIVPQFVQFIDGKGEVVDEIKDAAGHSLPVARETLTAAGPRPRHLCRPHPRTRAAAAPR